MASTPLMLIPLLIVLSTATGTTTVTLYRHLPHVVGAEQEQEQEQHPVSRLAAASLARASHLKKKNSEKQQAGHGGAALYPHSYGGYAFTASLGTPAQEVPVLLDTGSQLTWVPCTSSYDCRNCSSSFRMDMDMVVFHPKRSSSSRLVGCRNPSCQWVHHSISNKKSNFKCTNSSNVCPPYAVLYGSGSTAGLLIADTLRSPSASASASASGGSASAAKKDFVVGCSLVSVHQPPTGLAAFGRGAPSVPAQLGIDSFSYCLLSRRFDDNAAVSGQLVLGDAASSVATPTKGDAMQYAPFLVPNKSKQQPYSSSSVYYYLALTGITVAGKPVRLPQRAFVPGPRGGGAIVDSGTTFTYLDPTVFRPLADTVVAAVGGRYNRSKDVEDGLGLRPCFALPSNSKSRSMELPELSLRFKGGAEMRLPLDNYFVLAGRADPSSAANKEEAICLAVVTDIANAGAGGPAIILGSFQQQNYYVQYDLRKERLGFRRHPCASTS